MDNADKMLALVEAQLLVRLEAPVCDECGRGDMTVQELELIRKWINDHGTMRPAYGEGEAKGPRALPHKFVEDDTPLKEKAGG